MSATRTPSVETLIKRRKAQDEKLRAALAAENEAIARHQARRAELLALLGEEPSPNGHGVVPTSEGDEAKCADCGWHVSRAAAAAQKECPQCHASPFEEER